MSLAINILAEAERRGAKLRKQGRWHVGPCPKCGGRDRFAVNPKKGIWNCRGCGRGGDAINLVRHLDGIGYLDAVELLTGERPSSTHTSRRPTPPAANSDSDDYERAQHRKATWMWSRRTPIAGSIAGRYMRKARGYTGPLPATLAFLPPFKAHHHPAMIAAFAIADEIEPGLLGEPRNVDAIHL
jgi:CHC2 zinc finger